MVESDDPTRAAFFAEAEELVAALDRGLNEIDALLKRDTRNEGAEAETINEIFRAVHSLKGISSMFGATALATLSHGLEDLLDDLRLGRLPLTNTLLHLLSDSVGLCERILASQRDGKPEPAEDVRAFLDRLRKIVPRDEPPPSRKRYRLPEPILRSFTKYEEHRLRANEAAGNFLYFLHARFPLATLDAGLGDLKDQTRAVGEIISYLPAPSGSDAEWLNLDVLLASREAIGSIQSATAALGVTVEAIPFEGGHDEAEPFTPEEPIREPPPEPAPDPGLPDATDHERAPTSAPSVRVDIKKLDDLLNAVGELSSMRSILAKLEGLSRSDPKLRELLPEIETLRRTFDRRRAEVQARVLDVRMVPLAQVFDRLARIVRQTAREQNKDVNLIVTGAETEVDKLIVEALSDPLMGLVRHLVEDNIEDRDARLRAGKPVTATIALNAYVKGDRVILDVEDDGRGESARPPAPGTDAMKTSVAKLGGTIESTSTRGVGTRSALTLPVTLAIMSVLVVEVYRRLYCLPLANVEEVTPFEDTRVRRTAISQRGVTIPIVWLSALFGDHASDEQPFQPEARLVVARVAERRVGFVVDRVDGREDIVVKRLGRSLRKVDWLIGAAEVADQRLGFVVDVPVLVEEVLALQHR